MLINKSKMRYEFHITEMELTKIKCFLQGAVYCWIKNRKNEFFCARDLVGGDNYDWNGTPLIALYTKHKNLNKSEKDAIDDAGKDVGWILKLVLKDDKRRFEDKKIDIVKGYKWIS